MNSFFFSNFHYYSLINLIPKEMIHFFKTDYIYFIFWFYHLNFVFINCYLILINLLIFFIPLYFQLKMKVFLINYYDYLIFHYQIVLFSIELIKNHLIINFITHLLFLPNFKINFDYPLHYLTCFQFKFICPNVLIIFYSNS